MLRRNVLAVVLIACAALYGANEASTAARTTIFRMNAPVEPAQQLQFATRHPIRVAQIVVHDLAHDGWEYVCESIGVLGWLQIRLPQPVYWSSALVFLLAVLHRQNGRKPRIPRIVTLSAILVTTFAVAFSIYVVWTPLGADRIDGFQGRYLLPILGFFVLLPSVEKNRRWTVVAAIAWSYAVLAIALAAIDRYYS